MGTLRIQIAVKEGAVTAHLETDNAAARNVLLDNLPALRERLAEQEIRIEKFDVDVGRDDRQQTDNPETNDREANNSPSQTNVDETPTSTREHETIAEAGPIDRSGTSSGLDIMI